MRINVCASDAVISRVIGSLMDYIRAKLNVREHLIDSVMSRVIGSDMDRTSGGV